MMLFFLIFTVDFTINLMSELHHEYKRRKHYSSYSESTSKLLLQDTF